MSERFSGGFITKTPVTPTSTSASGIWTLDQQEQAQKAGNWPFGGPFNYIEDVFSSYVYTATGSAQTITNGIDLASKGGLVWVKSRTNTDMHTLQDTVRGTSSVLVTNATYASLPYTTNITAFNSNGYSIGTGSGTSTSGQNYGSWTFRKQPKFFDVVTWTGDGASSKTISHSLASTPGCIIVKKTSAASDWYVYHKYMFDSAGTFGAQGYINLNLAGNSTYIGNDIWTPTSTTFKANTSYVGLNEAGATYVAYLFAHNAGGFGATTTDNVISCGMFTTDANGTATVNVGYEPQWILYKSVSASGGWQIVDNIRGYCYNAANSLSPNSTATESNFSSDPYPFVPTATGFVSKLALAASTDYIYITIRRGPMKTPSSGTNVFAIDTRHATNPSFISNFPVDSWFYRDKTGSDWYLQPRLIQKVMYTNLTTAESGSTIGSMDSNVGVLNNGTVNIPNLFSYMLQRSPGFHDVVCYTGTSATQNISHNLGVVPELMIIKDRTSAQGWPVYNSTQGNTKILLLNSSGNGFTSSTYWNSTTPTSSVFTVGTNALTNSSGSNFVAYLFATCPGVSKVGSYTGTGATQTISCGFSGGARFVLIKRTDTTGGWYVWDTTRGMVAGTDPNLQLNTATAETNTNDVYTTTGGFQIVSTAADINASGGSYIYLAIA